MYNSNYNYYDFVAGSYTEQQIGLYMKHKEFAERLNQALDKEGFPPKNKGRIQLLAEMVGLTHRGASKWINGETKPPSKKYANLANKLKVNEMWLRTGSGPMQPEATVAEQILSNATKKIVPVYSSESFLKHEKIQVDNILCDLPIQGEAFAIKIETEAMSPRFPSGSTIIFDAGKEPADGDFILVTSKDYPVPIFRQLIKAGGTSFLHAHNPKFDRLTLAEDDKIIGVMIQAILSFT